MTEFINERLNEILRDRPILKLARDIMYFIVNSLWKSVSIVSNIADRNVTQHKTMSPRRAIRVEKTLRN